MTRNINGIILERKTIKKQETKWSEIAKEIEVGESIYFDDRIEGKRAFGALTYHDNNKRFATRTEGKGIRVYCVELLEKAVPPKWKTGRHNKPQNEQLEVAAREYLAMTNTPDGRTIREIAEKYEVNQATLRSYLAANAKT